MARTLKILFEQFLNGAGNSPKDRVALNMIKTVSEVLYSRTTLNAKLRYRRNNKVYLRPTLAM